MRQTSSPGLDDSALIGSAVSGASNPGGFSGFGSNPLSAIDVLAFVLCPAKRFAPSGDADELAAVTEILRPAKRKAVMNWQKAERKKTAN